MFGMSGEIFKVDPMHCIIKRIILTGYPHKVNLKNILFYLKFKLFLKLDTQKESCNKIYVFQP